MLVEGVDAEEAQEIKYYYLIRLDRRSQTKVCNFLEFLNKIVRNIVSAKSTFLENPEENQAINKIIDFSMLSEQLSNSWRHVLNQPSRRIIAEFILFVEEAIKVDIFKHRYPTLLCKLFLLMWLRRCKTYINIQAMKFKFKYLPPKHCSFASPTS